LSLCLSFARNLFRISAQGQSLTIEEFRLFSTLKEFQYATVKQSRTCSFWDLYTSDAFERFSLQAINEMRRKNF
jgi:hypothetical protein